MNELYFNNLAHIIIYLDFHNDVIQVDWQFLKSKKFFGRHLNFGILLTNVWPMFPFDTPLNPWNQSFSSIFKGNIGPEWQQDGILIELDKMFLKYS